MPDGGVFLRLLKSLTLDGVQVKQLRTFHVLNFVQYAHQIYYVMSINRTDVADVHTLKYILLIGEKRFNGVVESKDGATVVFVHPPPLRHLACKLVSESVVKVACLKLHQVVGHTSYRTVYAHVVVIQNDEHIVGRV